MVTDSLINFFTAATKYVGPSKPGVKRMYKLLYKSVILQFMGFMNSGYFLKQR
jgi:hypothetical protein